MPPIEKGKEPANIKKRLDTLFAKLDSAYPDKVISGLQKDHKHWAETVTELYRLLGYPDSETFLNAYGYTVKRAAAGRPKGNSEDIIEELKRRYPDGIPFSKISEIAEANPDLKATLKTVQNNANKLYGMSFRDYLTQLGLLNQGKKKSQAERLNHRKIKEEPIILTEEQYLELLKQRYADKENLPRDITQLCAENPDIPVRKLNKYLRKNGEPEAKHYYIRNHILQGKDTDTLEYDYCMVSFAHTVPGVGEKLFAYLPGENTYVPGDMVVAPFGWHGQVMGQVIEVIHCFGIDAPWPVAQTNRILRKAEPEEIANGKLSATQEVSETYVGNQSSKPQSAPVRKAPDWELEAAGDADNGIPENFVPADPRVFERKSQEDLRNKEWECCQFRFRGLRPEIRKLNRYLKENGSRDYTVSQVSDTVWEIRDCLGQKTMEAIEKFPALKVTGLAEHWWRQEVWVIYSESGYSGITNMDLGGYFDRRHDGGDGRWEWEYDMMEPVHVSFTWLQTGEDQEIYYRYPFAAIWDQDSYVREENGCIYVPRVEPEKEFEVENGRLMAYRGNGGDVVIPDTVREICTDTEPFSGNLLITSVRVPGSVKSISSGMFSGCKNLKRVILEEGLEVIERNAFSECTALSCRKSSFPHRCVTLMILRFQDAVAWTWKH